MDTWRHSAAALTGDLRRIFADRLRSLVAYGPSVEGEGNGFVTCLALVESLTVTDLEACARLAHQWERLGVAVPLILPDQEFRRSLDAFPLEYAEILRAHERLVGADPFAGVTIPAEDLRRACETQVKSHLLHLREAFVESGGRPQVIARLVSSSAPAFAALLRHVARLSGDASPARADATRAGARVAGLPDGIVADVLALDRPSTIPTTDAARLFPRYLAAVEQLARAVDSWRA